MSKTSRGASVGEAAPGWARLRQPPLMFAAAVAALFVAGFIIFILTSPERPVGLPPSEDGIVVLTGGPQRITEALDLLRDHHGKRLLITGVHPHTSERRLSQLSGEEALFDCCVDIDRAAADTRGNAEEARRWADEHQFDRLVIVTSNYHMARAMLEFSRRMPDRTLVPWPVSALPDLPGPQWAVGLRMWLGEYVKFLFAMVAPASTLWPAAA